MRKKEREITDPAKIADILNRSFCCRIGFIDDGAVYIVPLNFGYRMDESGCVFYFHGAKEGRKIDLIRKSPKVGFELDTNHALNESETACGFSTRYQSVIGNGVAGMVENDEEKRLGLSLLMEHTTGRGGWTFADAMVNAVAVFKLTVTGMTCKEHP